MMKFPNRVKVHARSRQPRTILDGNLSGSTQVSASMRFSEHPSSLRLCSVFPRREGKVVEAFPASPLPIVLVRPLLRTHSATVPLMSIEVSPDLDPVVGREASNPGAGLGRAC